MTRPRPGRASPVDPAALTPAQREVFARIQDSRGRVVGPFTTLLHIPELADRVQRLGAYLRYETALERDLAEAAVLTTSRVWGCAFEWDEHEVLAQRAGVPDSVINALRVDSDLADLPVRFRVTCAFARALASSGQVPDDVYQAGLSLLGTAATVELTVLVGYYTMLAMTLNAHGIEGVEPSQPSGASIDAG